MANNKNTQIIPHKKIKSFINMMELMRKNIVHQNNY